MKTTHVHVKTVRSAFDLASRLFPTTYSYDQRLSDGAGYPIYSTDDQTLCGSDFCWISDLNTSLELNLPKGDNVRIWIDDEWTGMYH